MSSRLPALRYAWQAQLAANLFLRKRWCSTKSATSTAVVRKNSAAGFAELAHTTD
jgi:hypothetical protein